MSEENHYARESDSDSFENGLLSFQLRCFQISNRSVTSTEVKLFRQASIFFPIVK